MVLRENEEKRRKILLLNEKGIQFLGKFQHFVLFNLIYLRFKIFYCLDLLGCILKFIGNEECGKINDIKEIMEGSLVLGFTYFLYLCMLFYHNYSRWVFG